ncbi:MAG: transglycosylase domain-containing protein [Saprospiraceae bacterium]
MTQGKKISKKTNTSKPYTTLIWILGLGLLLFIMLIFVFVKFSRLPDISELDNPKYEFSTIIYDINNKELGKYFKYNRVWTTYDELNPDVVNALVATEDIRFFKHSGIDTRGTLRAFFYLGKKGGASTITQQLAKLFFTERPSNSITRLWQKLQEWVIATELEKRYTKEEILAMYLNKFDFRYNSHGIESAAKTYFGKSQKDLTTDEAAILIGMLKWPYKYDPVKKPQNAFYRRNIVLSQMNKYGFLDDDKFAVLKEKPVDASRFSSTTSFKGPAPYFRTELIKWINTLLDDRRYRKPDGTKYDIDLDGLKIYTTIDLDYQQLAEKAVYDRMKDLQQTFDQTYKGMDVWNYNADSKQKSIRNATLNRFIKESNRFKNLRENILGTTIDSVLEVFPDARLWDIDIERMLAQEKDKSYLDKLLDESYISSKQYNAYNELLNSELWNLLKSKQAVLNNSVRKSFNTKVKMKVFAYNEAGESTVTMTPLDSIKYHKNFLQTGMLAIDPHNGYIKAWVGGINYKYFMYDHINSKRQVGSTFKPFVYATAISNKGISPCFKVQDVQYSITPGEGDFGLSTTWSPSNADNFSGDYYTLYDGLFKSKNSVSVFLMKELGNVDIVRETASKFGIDEKDIPRQPSICLGSADLSVMQMTSAYAVFANNGYYNKPTFVVRIEDRNGRVIYKNVPEKQEAFSENYNYVMLKMLRYVAKTIQPKFVTPVGGKTGTTNDYRDGWFMGITPDLVVGTWVGGDEQWIKFNSITYGQGAFMARPIFEKFLTSLEQSKNVDFKKITEFPLPEKEIDIELNCEEYDKINKSQVIEEEFEE